MKSGRTSSSVPHPRCKAKIWTVISVVDERIFCSVHHSEHQAYREAVAQFESVESGAARADSHLKALLEVANGRGDYHEVRRYIADNASQIRMIQLAEHTPSAVSAPTSRLRKSRRSLGPLR
jgi:hypothetical protein